MITAELVLTKEGARINGHPVLGVDEIRKWFLDEGCDIPVDAAASIARDLNHCALFSFMWKNTPEFSAARRNNKSWLSMQRIHTSLRSLQNELPVLIANTLTIRTSISAQPTCKTTHFRAQPHRLRLELSWKLPPHLRFHQNT